MASVQTRLLYSRNSWIADGVDTLWNFTFTGGYIDKNHVKAWIRNTTTGAVSMLPINYSTDFLGPYQLQIVPAVPAGMELTIARDTPKDLPLVNFADRAQISEVSLDTNAKQAVFIASESVDAILAELLVNSLDDEYGYKSMRHETYTGASVLGVIDNGRSHYKTDGTQVTVPNTLKVEFLSTIINDSALDMPIVFTGGGAYLQGSSDATVHSNWSLGAYSLLSMTKVSDGRWFVSGRLSKV